MDALLNFFSLSGHVAIVTGASAGIGKQCAKTLAEAGANVVIAARRQEVLDEVQREIEPLDNQCATFCADLNDTENMVKLAAFANERFGRIDIVVNNVGGSFPRGILETSEQMFERSFHFNVTTALALSKAAVPNMLESGPVAMAGANQSTNDAFAQSCGSIINISSLIGRTQGRGYVAYGTAKAALTHMTSLMAHDLAPRIRVNSIGVGSTETEALREVLTNDLRIEMIDKTPLKRLGTPLDIALGALYLASPASAFVTGKQLNIDGGLDAPNLDLSLPDV